MFRKITIQNFKSLVDTSVELGPFTVLVGNNGAGKSSFLQALELMSWAVRYASVNDALAAHHIDFRDLVYLRSAESTITLKTELALTSPNHSDREQVVVEMHFKKKRYVYLDFEAVLPSNLDKTDPTKIADSPFAVISIKRSRSAWDRSGEHIYHDNVALGHSMLRDVYQSRRGEERSNAAPSMYCHFVVL